MVQSRPVQHVVVVGAGMVGLSCAWHLLKRGADVTVLERSTVGAGASWGNAGYLTPAFVVPLPEPALLREGLRGVFDPAAPLALDWRPSTQKAMFAAGFLRNATLRRWRRGLASLTPLNAVSLDAFDELARDGVAVKTRVCDINVGFRAGESAAGLIKELEEARRAGAVVDWRETEPRRPMSSAIETALVLNGQRYVDPGATLDALANALRAGGAVLTEGASVRSLAFGPKGLRVDTWAGQPVLADAVVLATGAWLPELAKPLGVRPTIQAGRGYSCTVPLDEPLPAPLYLPGVRVALTPYRHGARLAGTMEITDGNSAFRSERLEAIQHAVRPLIDGADWDNVSDPWVGPRPLTPDGLPVIGATKMPGVYVAGGHGMWGLTLGPVTGRLLAEQIMTGRAAREAIPFDPQRRSWITRSPQFSDRRGISQPVPSPCPPEEGRSDVRATVHL